MITLRDVEDADLAHFYAHQQDPQARRMAAFVGGDDSRAAFDAHWEKIRARDTITLAAILCESELAGHLASFHRGDEREVTYWIARERWGQGVATEALRLFLTRDPTRPLFARVAHDNVGSARVLVKCGFQLARRERGYAEARGAEIDERVYALT